MKIFEITEDERHGNDSTYDKCWTGYRKVPGKTRGEKGSCVKEETGPSGADMLAKVDMLLQNTGIKREGFKLIKDPAPQGSVRGSITQEAIDMIKATLAKAKAMGATEPVDPTPTINPADITDKDFGETTNAGSTAKGAAILANIDMALDGSGLKRQGFELVKDTNSFTRGSITREAEAAIRNSLAKAKTLLGGVEPEDPKPIMTKAELARQEFGEEASAGSTGAGDLAAVANPTSANAKIKRDKNGVPVAPQKKNPDGTAKNALELSNNLMGGKAIKR